MARQISLSASFGMTPLTNYASLQSTLLYFRNSRHRPLNKIS